MSGYRLTSICSSQWDMAIYIHLNILGKIYSKDIKSPFTINDLMENSLLNLDKYILPLFGPNRNNSTPRATLQNRLNNLFKNGFIDRVPYEYCFLTKKGEQEAIRVYNEFIRYFSEADIFISSIENKFINSNIDDFNEFFFNIDNAYKILVKFELIAQETAETNLRILNERKSRIMSSKNDEISSIMKKREELINNNAHLLEKLGLTKKQALKIATKNQTSS